MDFVFFPQEIFQSLMNLSVYLHSLQVSGDCWTSSPGSGSHFKLPSLAMYQYTWSTLHRPIMLYGFTAAVFFFFDRHLLTKRCHRLATQPRISRHNKILVVRRCSCGWPLEGGATATVSLSFWCLQAAVIKQDSILELLLQPHDAVTAAGGSLARLSWRDGQSAEVTPGSTIGELALLQRQHSLLQEELLRLRDAESRFRDSERARAKLERQVRQMKGCSGTSSSRQQGDEDLLQVSTAQNLDSLLKLSHCNLKTYIKNVLWASY